MSKRKWSDLPSWVRAKIIKSKQGSVSNKTIQVTPVGKGTSLSAAAMRKEAAWAKSAENSLENDLKQTKAHLKTLTNAPVNRLTNALFLSLQNLAERQQNDLEKKRSTRALLSWPKDSNYK